MKSEPAEFSIDDLERHKTEMWDGVRNYQVRNMFRDEMHPGDVALFYHSNAGTAIGVVGVMQVVSPEYPDPTQFDPKSAHPDPKSDPDNPRWLCVDVAFKRKLPRLVRLEELKAEPALAKMPLVQRGSRLSVMPLSKEQFEFIINMSER